MLRIRVKPLLCIMAAMVLLFGILMYIQWSQRPYAIATFSNVRMGGVTVVIDPGHGGEDGGAVSASGTVESHVNLAIGLKLDALMHFYGVDTVMVREEDISIHDDTAETLREKKRSDLENRVELINGVSNGVLISIHQNTYPSTELTGAQVFYADAGTSYDWAVLTQELLRDTLDERNHRQAAMISDSVYLMQHIERPAILVECGFLSSPQEEEKLTNDTYQTKLAATLMAGAMAYYG